MYKFCKNSRNFSLVIPFHRCFEHLFIEWIGVENEKERKEEKKKLFAKSFIYRGQIDSLSNQSASNNEESYSFLVHPSFRSRPPPFPHHRVLPCLPSLPPVSFSFAFLSGNKQLLSTFRPAKWEKATAVQLFASLTGFARISTTEM